MKLFRSDTDGTTNFNPLKTDIMAVIDLRKTKTPSLDQEMEISLNNFDGFYHSYIDISEYIDDELLSPEEQEKINWAKTEANVSKAYLDLWKRKNSEILKELEIEIEFKQVDSPREYNFRTDELVCMVKFNFDNLKTKFISKTENDKNFAEFISGNYKSYSGFCSFYSNDSSYWLGEYLEEENFDNIIFQGFLEFLTEDLDSDEKIYNLMENYFEFIEFN